MNGSNSTALRQHAYSVFTASRREGSSSVLARPHSSSIGALAPPWSAPRSSMAEPKSAGLAGTPGVTDSIGLPGRLAGEIARPKQRPDRPETEPGGSGSQSVGPGRPISEDAIRRRAYEIYRGRQAYAPGDPVRDWLQAEAELRAERDATDAS
ncbi:MAG: DUF2934 domain-containing protein [Planctomycetota bacterium]